MTFITGFNDATGKITSLNKELSELIFSDSKFNDVTIKIIGSNAGINGKFTKIDMSLTEIETIESNGFFSCSNLRELTLPSTLKLIGDNSFYNTALINIAIPGNVQIMTGNAWNQSPFIESFTVDESNSFFSSQSGYLFNKDKTVLVRAPKSVETEKDIPNYANLRSIGRFAFTSTKLRSFSCTSKLNTLDEYSFHVTRFAVKIDLSLGRFRAITKYCFWHSYAKEILLPITVETISINAFNSLPNLTTLFCYRRIKSIDKSAFINCPNLKVLCYLGRYDFSNVECFENDINIEVKVSPIYPSNYFCKVNVSKVWIFDAKQSKCSQWSIRKRINLMQVFIALALK